MTAFQFLPPLSDEDYEALKADIANRGVLVPIEYDQDGEVLDGHHRLRACKELGITKWPTVYRTFATDAERRTHARQLNLARRHLTSHQRRVLVEQELKENPEKSNRRIAADLRVDDKTVQAVRAVMEEGCGIPHLTKTVGADGKSYPSRKPSKPKATASSRHDADIMALARAWEMACLSARGQFLRSLGYEPHQSETTEGGDHVTAFTQEQDSEAGVHASASTQNGGVAYAEDEKHAAADPSHELEDRRAASGSDGLDSRNGGDGGGDGQAGPSEAHAAHEGPPLSGEEGGAGVAADQRDSGGASPSGGLNREWPDCPPSLLRDASNPLGKLTAERV